MGELPAVELGRPRVTRHEPEESAEDRVELGARTAATGRSAGRTTRRRTRSGRADAPDRRRRRRPRAWLPRPTARRMAAVPTAGSARGCRPRAAAPRRRRSVRASGATAERRGRAAGRGVGTASRATGPRASWSSSAPRPATRRAADACQSGASPRANVSVAMRPLPTVRGMGCARSDANPSARERGENLVGQRDRARRRASRPRRPPASVIGNLSPASSAANQSKAAASARASGASNASRAFAMPCRPRQPVRIDQVAHGRHHALTPASIEQRRAARHRYKP